MHLIGHCIHMLNKHVCYWMLQKHVVNRNLWHKILMSVFESRRLSTGNGLRFQYFSIDLVPEYWYFFDNTNVYKIITFEISHFDWKLISVYEEYWSDCGCLVSASDVHGPLAKCIRHTKVETLQEFRSRRQIGWIIQDFQEMCVLGSLTFHLETKMLWR